MSHRQHLGSSLRLLAMLLALAVAAPAAGQSTQPVWWPPFTMYGRPVSQPFFDFPPWARYSYCRPAPLVWGYDPFPNYGPGDCAPWEPPTAACEPPFVAHRPSAWYGSADFAPLTVDHLDGFALASVGPFGPVVLSTEDLRTEFAASGKYTIGRRLFDTCYRVEGTYIGYANWSDQRVVFNEDPIVVNNVASTGNLSTFLSGFANPPVQGLDFANFAAAAIRTNFQSGEVNVRYWGDMPPGPLDVSLLVGARYLRIGEQFQFNMQSNVPAVGGGTTIDLQANTLNQLWGAQIGIEFSVLVTTRWWFDLDLKGGIFNNRIETTSTQLINGNPGLIVDQRDRTAWVGDISLVGNWQMTPSWVLRAGYQAIFINGVSLAQDQAVAAFFTNTAGPLADMGKLAYHGPILGIMANW